MTYKAKTHSSVTLYKIHSIVGVTFSNNDIKSFVNKGQLSGMNSSGFIAKTGKSLPSMSKPHATVPEWVITKSGLRYMNTYYQGFITPDDTRFINDYKSYPRQKLTKSTLIN